MKATLLIAALLLSGSAFADNYRGDPDMQPSILNDHAAGARFTAVEPGIGDEYGNVLVGGRITATAAPAGSGDLSRSDNVDLDGNVLVDIGAYH